MKLGNSIKCGGALVFGLVDMVFGLANRLLPAGFMAEDFQDRYLVLIRISDGKRFLCAEKNGKWILYPIIFEHENKTQIDTRKESIIEWP